jgi:hypothetical protein
MSEDSLKNMEVVQEEVVQSEVGADAPDDLTPTDELSPQEKEIIRKNRAKSQLVLSAKNKIDAILQEHNCVLKINPNSPIAQPQIIVDTQ